MAVIRLRLILEARQPWFLAKICTRRKLVSLSSLFMSRKRDPICNTIRDSVTNINYTLKSTEAEKDGK